jgi:hypothetical protein
MRLRILLLGFILLTTACTSMVIGGGQSSGVYHQQDGRSLQQVSEDADITQRVQGILENHTQIDVYTTNGTVTLQGTATSQREVQRIIGQVYRVDGVNQVDSQLVVSSQ